MYILFNKENKTVIYKNEKKPKSYTDDLELVEVQEIPIITNAQYLTYENGNILVNDKQPNQKEIAVKRIAELKKSLSETDYLAIKYAEGWLNEEEYAPIKSQRQVWRDEINNLQHLYGL